MCIRDRDYTEVATISETQQPVQQVAPLTPVAAVQPTVAPDVEYIAADSTPYQAVVPTQGYESQEDLRVRLAAIAKQTGVMQAAPGTEQGKTGWYIDVDGHLSSWTVGADGSWTKMQ